MCLNNYTIIFQGKKLHEILKKCYFADDELRHGRRGIRPCFYVVPLPFQTYNHIHFHFVMPAKCV